MSQAPNMQQALFQQIKEKIPPHLSLVDEISDLLEISEDSVYRRIRGEKSLSLEELQKISTNFNISLDSLFNIKSQNVVFSQRNLNSSDFNFEQYLNSILEDLKRVQAYKYKEIIYFAKEVPIFHYFHFPALATFKIFVWLKTIFQFPEYEDKKFSLESIPENYIKIGLQIADVYKRIPSKEVWNEETINSILQQLDFYLESGYLENKEDVFLVLDDLENFIKHLHNQAKYGFNFNYGDEPIGEENSYMLYYNGVIMGDNTVQIKTDDFKLTYITYNVISLLITTDPVFNSQIEESLKVLMNKSTLISIASEKERNKFFNKLYAKINNFRSQIS